MFKTQNDLRGLIKSVAEITFVFVITILLPNLQSLYLNKFFISFFWFYLTFQTITQTSMLGDGPYLQSFLINRQPNTPIIVGLVATVLTTQLTLYPQLHIKSPAINATAFDPSYVFILRLLMQNGAINICFSPKAPEGFLPHLYLFNGYASLIAKSHNSWWAVYLRFLYISDH